MYSKKVGVIVIFIMMLLLVIGCSKDGGSSSPSEGNNKGGAAGTNTQPPVTQGEDKTPEPPKEVELVLYTDAGDNEESVYTNMIEPLVQKYPHIKMSIISGSASKGTSIAEMLASNTKFDIYYHGRGPFEQKLIEFNLMYDMTELIKKHNVDISYLEPTALASIKEAFEGKIHGLPISLNSLVLYYNKSLFDQFGYDYPTDGMIWDEVMDLARKMTRSEGDNKYFGFSINNVAQALSMNSLSIPYADLQANKPTINTDELWRLHLQTEFMNDPLSQAFKHYGKIPNWSVFLQDQNIAMMHGTSALGRDLDGGTSLDWDMVSLPLYDRSYNTGSRVTPTYYGITSISEHPDEAMEAIKFWLSDEFQVERSKIGIVTASRTENVMKAFATETHYPDKNWGAITYYAFSPLAPMAPYENNIRSVITKHIPSVISGEVDLNTALRTMEEEAQIVVNEFLSQQ